MIARRRLAPVIVLVALAAFVVVTAASLNRPRSMVPDPTAAAAETPRAASASPTISPSPTPKPAATATSTPSEQTTDAAGVDPSPIVLAFTGDVHGERQIAAALGAGQHPLADIAPVLGDADLTVVNLETPVGTTGSPAPKTYTFRAPVALLDELVDAGVDVVSLANNHSLDYGRASLLESLELVRSRGLAAIGAGSDAREAYAPSIHRIRGRTIALVGLTRVWPEPGWAAASDRPGLAGAYDVHAAISAVVEAAAVADLVVVVVHWGPEGADCPDRHQRTLADALLAAGATAVVGHHPHVLQPVELRERKLIAYSLGNFLWYTAGPVSRLTGVLRLELDEAGVRGWSLVPAVIDPSDGGPRPAAAADADTVRARISRSCPPPG